MKIGYTITKIRKEKNLSQEEFAEILNVSRQTISNWENEKSYPDLSMIVEISNRLNISLDQILKDDEKVVNEIDKNIRMNKVLKIVLVIIIFIFCFIMIFLGIQKYNSDKQAREDKVRYNEIINKISELGFSKRDGIGFYSISEDGVTYKIYGKMLEVLDEYISASTAWTDEEAIMVDYDGKKVAVTYLNENVTTVFCDEKGNILNSKQNKKNNEIYNKYKDKTVIIVKRMIELFNEVYNQ